MTPDIVEVYERPGITPTEEFDDLQSGFETAWATYPDQRRERWFTFADQPVRFRIVGAGLAEDVFRAFSHLKRDSDGEEPELTVGLWDEGETGLDVEGLEPYDDLNAQGASFASDDGTMVVTARPQTRTAYHRVERDLYGWVADHRRLTQYELGRPLHSELMLWHKDRDVQAVHAGLVARNGNGILFGGPGGSGKSTTALTCLKAGFEYMADDYVGLELTDDGAYDGHSLFCSTHLEPGHLQRFPYLVPHAVPGRLPREDKSLVLLSNVLPEGLSRKARIRAVALPRVVDIDRPRLRPASTIEALLRLAPSSLILLPYAGTFATEFEKLSVFLENIPTYWLELGREMEEIPDRIDELLERHT
jgi:hypothetical protein